MLHSRNSTQILTLATTVRIWSLGVYEASCANVGLPTENFRVSMLGAQGAAACVLGRLTVSCSYKQLCAQTARAWQADNTEVC